jgi:hypothetical protein
MLTFSSPSGFWDSRLLGRICRAWDDDDLGVYQGECSPSCVLLCIPPPRKTTSISVLTCELNLGLVWNQVVFTPPGYAAKVSPVQHSCPFTPPSESMFPPPSVSCPWPENSPRSAVACVCGVYSATACLPHVFWLIITSPRRTCLRASSAGLAALSRAAAGA